MSHSAYESLALASDGLTSASSPPSSSGDAADDTPPRLAEPPVPESPLSSLLFSRGRNGVSTSKKSLSSFAEQSEYGPLSYVLSFLPVVEILPLRCVSLFFERLVHVAVRLRTIGDAELVDVNVRCAKYWAKKAKATHQPRYRGDTTSPPALPMLHRPVTFPLMMADGGDEEEEEEGETEKKKKKRRAEMKSGGDVPAELLQSFGFLIASPSRLSLMHVETSILVDPAPSSSSRNFKKVSACHLNLLVSDSLLQQQEKAEKEEEKKEGEEEVEDPSSSSCSSSSLLRFGSFVWAIGLRLSLIEKGNSVGRFTHGDSAYGYGYDPYRKGRIFVTRSGWVDKTVHEIPFGCGMGDEEEREEEESEGEGEEEEEKEDRPQFLFRLRRGRVEYGCGVFEKRLAGGTQSLPSQYSGEWDAGRIDGFVKLCKENAEELVPLYSSQDLREWLQKSTRFEGKTALLFRLLEVTSSLLVGFLHDFLVTPERGSRLRFFEYDPDDEAVLARKVAMVLQLLEIRVVPFSDSAVVFLNRLFEIPIGWLSARKRPAGVYLSRRYTALARIVSALMNDRGYVLDFTEKQYLAQMEGMVRANDDPLWAGWDFLESVGMTFDHLFVDGSTNPLMQAASGNANHVFKFFFSGRIGRASSVLSLVDSEKRNVLHYALLAPEGYTHTYSRASGQGTIIEMVLHHHSDLFSMRDVNGDTALEYALHKSKFRNAKILFERKEIQEAVVQWDLTRHSKESVFERVRGGKDLYQMIERDHKLIFPDDHRRKAFAEACEKRAPNIALLIDPLFGSVNETTPDQDTLIPLALRQKVFAQSCRKRNIDVACFLLPSIPLDQEIPMNKETEDPFPLTHATRTRNERLLRKFVESAKASSRWESHLLPLFRRTVPEIIVSLLGPPRGSTLRKEWSFLFFLGIVRCLLDLVWGEDAIDNLLSVMGEHSLTSEFFVAAVRSGPRVLGRMVVDDSVVPLSVREELFCDSLVRRDSAFAAGILPCLNVASPLLRVRLERCGGWVSCQSCTPLCLAFHARMANAVDAGLCALDEEDEKTKEEAILQVGRCFLSLSPFFVKKYEDEFARCFGVLLDHCPGMMERLTKMFAESKVGQLVTPVMNRMKWFDVKKWIEGRADAEAILQSCGEFFSLLFDE